MFRRLALLLVLLVWAPASCSESGQDSGASGTPSDAGDGGTHPDAASDAGVAGAGGGAGGATIDAASDARLTDADDSSGGQAGNSPTDSGSLQVTALEVTENPANVLSAYVSWTTSEPSRGTLYVQCPPDYLAEVSVSTVSDHHEVFVMGLISGTTCTARVEAGAGDGLGGSRQTDFDVGPLPSGLPELALSTLLQGQVQPGWTLFNLNNHFDSLPLLIVTVDAQGRYRWYHERASTQSGADNNARVVAEGVLVGGSRDLPAALVDWEGTLRWEASFRMHHHLEPRPDGTYVYLYDSSANCPSAHPAGVIVRYAPDSNTAFWLWRLCEHFVPPAYEPDWSHTNAVDFYPGESAVLLSSRVLNSIFKIDLGTEEIEWQLGEGGDFTLPSEARFYRQHAPELQPNGNLLLFDNGMRGARLYSRALELRLDETNRTAELAWEFRPTPDLFAPIWGDADRLENGNTLVTFGRRGELIDSHLIEVRADGTEVWHLVTPQRWGIYRAERITPPALGFER